MKESSPNSPDGLSARGLPRLPSTVLDNASLLPMKLHRENIELRKELLALYEREVKLLKFIDLRDQQIAAIRAGRPEPKNRIEIKSPKGDDPSVDDLKIQLEKLKSRYEALSESKLGRAQRWYWKLRSGNNK